MVVACRLLQELASLDRTAEDARLEDCLEAVELDYLLARYFRQAAVRALQSRSQSTTRANPWRFQLCWRLTSHVHSFDVITHSFVSPCLA